MFVLTESLCCILLEPWSETWFTLRVTFYGILLYIGRPLILNDPDTCDRSAECDPSENANEDIPSSLSSRLALHSSPWLHPHADRRIKYVTYLVQMSCECDLCPACRAQQRTRPLDINTVIWAAWSSVTPSSVIRHGHGIWDGRSRRRLEIVHNQKTPWRKQIRVYKTLQTYRQ